MKRENRLILRSSVVLEKKLDDYEKKNLLLGDNNIDKSGIVSKYDISKSALSIKKLTHST